MAVTSRRFVATRGMATIVVSRRPPRRRTRDLGRSSGRNAPGSRVRPPWLECGRWPGRGVPRRLRRTSGHDAALAPFTCRATAPTCWPVLTRWAASRQSSSRGRPSCSSAGNAHYVPVLGALTSTHEPTRTTRCGAALTCTSIARRRTRQPDQTCCRHEGDINPAAVALLRSKAAFAVASNVVSERRAERPPASGTVYRRSRLLCRAPPPGGGARLTTWFTGGTRCRPTPQLVEIDQCPTSSANHAVACLA